MATTVPNNPFDTQPKASGSTGLVGNAMSGGATTGASAAQSTTMPGVSNMSAQTYNPLTREVDRATETAAGQVESLLAKDNPLMQRARTLATQGMNRRGLVNSSINQGAGVAAMIDKITPLAQQDALTYSGQSQLNQKTINEAGQFNVGEINKFGLQKDDQAFTSKENTTNRQFQTSERIGGQTFTSEQNKATQDFQAAQSQLDRALQTNLAEKSIESQKALQNAQQVFQGAQNELDRVNQKALQESQQLFTSKENQLDREQQTSLAAAAQAFQATESEKNRAADLMLADKNITANQALEQSRQSFLSEQNGLDRTQAVSLAKEAQSFQATQNELNRAQDLMLADKNITANQALEQSRQSFLSEQNGLDRTQAVSLAKEAQSFQATQNELNRAQDLMLADKNITANQALEQSRQSFTAGQNELDRSQQSSLAAAAQNFQATQNEIDRAQQIMLADKNIDANKALEQAKQEFQRGENVADRTQQTTIADKQITANKDLQTAQQTFTTAQNELDRAQQRALSDNSIQAQKDLQTAQQTFTTAQNELDRTQQSNLAQAQIDANKSLAAANQAFQATQNSLDRAQQESMVRLSDSLSQSNVSKTFAANLTLQTSNAINAIAADPNLSSAAKDKDPVTGLTPKQAAIQNAIDNANYTMQWGSTFYDVPLPKIGTPGSTTSPGVVNPGQGAGAGAATRTATAATAADIADIYQSVLGRAPDAEGLRNWVGTGLTADEIRNQIGRSDEAVNRGLVGTAMQGGASQPPAPAPAPAPAAQSNQSAAYTWALSNGGIDVMYQNINKFLAGNPTAQQIEEAKAAYGISDADIAEARARSNYSNESYGPTQSA